MQTAAYWWRSAMAVMMASSVGATVVQAQVGDIGVHDPSIIKQGDTYYIFHTGRGVPIKTSADLIHWANAGRVFDSMPGWASEAVPKARFSMWAPDISYFNGRYHLYYAVSSFGSQRSAIGLATNATLDPASPDYEWRDEGLVVQSEPGVSTFNAIDPNVVLDEDGQPWLDWGSFWGGIKMRRLDLETGKPSTRDTTLYSLAARDGIDAVEGPTDLQSIEGPFIIHHGGDYYLFASFDMCCRGVLSTYNVRVGRSTVVTGPYVDQTGRAMTDGGGTVLLAGVGRIRGPGHNSILTDGDSEYMVHHYYDAEDDGRSKLQIRPITWKKDGWPMVGDPLTPPE